MEYLKYIFLSTLLDLGMGFITLLLFGLLVFVGILVILLGEKEWNLVIKIILCFFLLISAQIIANVAIVFYSRFDGLWVFLLGTILGSAFIPLVFFIAIPRQGKRVALFFVVALVAQQILAIYCLEGKSIIEAILIVGSAVLTFIGLSKCILFEEQY